LGFDCTISDAKVGRTCNKTLYATDAKTGDPVLFGVPCQTDDSPCQGTADKNPMPQCRKGNKPSETTAVTLNSDPNGYCTGSCTNDNDCPLAMKCAADFDGVTKCLKRNVCDECQFDENCGSPSGVFQSDFTKCVPTKDGTSRYCTKECLSDGDCPGAVKKSKWMLCQDSTSSDGTESTYCLHWYGACVGQGNVCDPCRAQSDCGTGLKCVDNPFGFFSYPWSGERMCNKVCCTKFNRLADGMTAGSCADTNPDANCKGPNTGITCDYTSPNVDTPSGPAPGASTFECTDDPTHRHPGVWGCNL
jgi:hypothetical protein